MICKSKKLNVYLSAQEHKRKVSNELAAVSMLPKAELVRRLRERGQPILLFGETSTDACERLKQFDIDAPDTIGSQASGSTNDFK